MALGKTVGELLEDIGAAEMTEWMAFAQLEPFGGAVDDLRAGIGPAVAANSNRQEGSEVIHPMDFFPWHRSETRREVPPDEDTPEVLAAKLRAMLNAKGSK